jgi:tetratricopeptide (TPR) repeat protein
VSHTEVGDALKAQGNLTDALKAYHDSLAIRERLAEADPNNAGWQRDLSVSSNTIGDVQVAQGNLPEALKLFRDSLAIAVCFPKIASGRIRARKRIGAS